MDEQGITRLRIIKPLIVICTFVAIIVAWASFFKISGAVIASGTVRVEGNAKDLKYRAGGVVKHIFVREGQRVKRGSVLIEFDDTLEAAQVAVLDAAYLAAQAELTRYQAVLDQEPRIQFPREMIRRSGDLVVAKIMHDQNVIYTAQNALYQQQVRVFGAEENQIVTQIGGLKAQERAVGTQARLIEDELNSVKDLNRSGYAPRTRVLELQRSAASLAGQSGVESSDIARASEQIGDVQLRLAELRDKRDSDAAEGIRQMEERIADVVPKLKAAQASLKQTIVRAPVDGYVLDLTQFTDGGVAQPGERLMQIVPRLQRPIIVATIRSIDIAQIHVGMRARVTLSAYNTRTTPPVEGRIKVVSADALIDPETKTASYNVEVAIRSAQLRAAGSDIRLTPGMPVSVAIPTTQRTIMDYLLGPMTEGMGSSLRER